MANRDLKKEYEKLINSSKVFLFMKGTPNQPMCGFSFRVANLLNEKNIDFKYFNILEDFELREAIKKFSSWPTYPQLYVNSKLIGGCEIIEELEDSGELDQILN